MPGSEQLGRGPCLGPETRQPLSRAPRGPGPFHRRALQDSGSGLSATPHTARAVFLSHCVFQPRGPPHCQRGTCPLRVPTSLMDSGARFPPTHTLESGGVGPAPTWREGLGRAGRIWGRLVLGALRPVCAQVRRGWEPRAAALKVSRARGRGPLHLLAEPGVAAEWEGHSSGRTEAPAPTCEWGSSPTGTPATPADPFSVSTAPRQAQEACPLRKRPRGLCSRGGRDFQSRPRFQHSETGGRVCVKWGHCQGHSGLRPQGPPPTTGPGAPAPVSVMAFVQRYRNRGYFCDTRPGFSHLQVGEFKKCVLGV